ncbi:MAG: DNA-binding IclR family transcriptional regulator [Paracoccaceae bacterium]|jgi:DNA-binding IclR family transcriptional regulator
MRDGKTRRVGDPDDALDDLGADPGADLGADRKFVTSLARGLEILRAFRAGEHALTNQQLAERTRLPKPTVTRLTYTLCALGYLIYSEHKGAYQLGPGILGLGYSVLSSMEMRERALPIMDDLARTPGVPAAVTVALAERHNLKAVYVAVRRAPQTVSLTLEVGARLPLGASAVGRAILASMHAPERELVLAELGRRYPEHDRTTRDNVARAQVELATRGFVASFGDWKPEINGVAAPILSPDGERIFAMNVGGPAFLVSPQELEEKVGPRLALAARDLSLTRATPEAAS